MNKDEELKKEFMKQKGLTEWNDLYTPAYNQFKSGPEGVKFLQSLNKTQDEDKNKEQMDNAVKQAKADTAATTAYDKGTLAKSNPNVSKKTQKSNLQKTTNKVQSTGKSKDAKVPSNTAAENIGTKAAESDKELTDEDAENIVKEETAKDSPEDIVNASPELQDGMIQAGVDTSDPNSKVTPQNVDNAESILTENNGGVNPLDSASPKSAAETIEDSNRLGTWDKLAIGLTVFSFCLAALSGGQMLPIDFTHIGGTQDRIKALTQVRKDRDDFKTNLANTHDAEADRQQYFQTHPDATEEDYKAYQQAAGEYKYNVDEKSAQDTSDMDTWLTQNKITNEQAKELKSIEHRYGLEDAQMANLLNLKVIDANGKWDIAKINANKDAQIAISNALQKNQNAAGAEMYKSLIDAGMSHAEAAQKLGITNDGQRYFQNAMTGINTVGNIAGTAAKALSPTESDENKKEVKHVYLADRNNKSSKKHEYIPKERR